MFNLLYSKFNKLAVQTKEAFYEGLEEDIDPEILAALKTLTLDKYATFEEIKKRYKQLSRQYHPDSGSQNQVAMFLCIKEAYDVLKSHYKKKGLV